MFDISVMFVLLVLYCLLYVGCFFNSGCYCITLCCLVVVVYGYSLWFVASCGCAGLICVSVSYCVLAVV